MFEQAFRNIDDVLRKESGCTTELDYTEQTSWLLFLRYLDGLEEDKATEAKLNGKNVHMASASEDDPLGFDYLLKDGVNRTTNAMAIVRLLGLE